MIYLEPYVSIDFGLCQALLAMFFKILFQRRRPALGATRTKHGVNMDVT